MKHENEPEGLPVCNFCDKEYDPHDKHICAGNMILPREKLDASYLGEDGLKVARCVPGEFVSAAYATEWDRTEAQMRKIGEAILARRSALDSQSGGDHYRKLPIQPVEYIIANGIGFLAGNVIKYASRYKDKGGADDIRKIKHYCDLILEFEYKEKS